ncbi:MAG: sugar phosphate isomerase/epimerase [Enterobacteriaceae bacterium]|nr:sugar phosphate isomerase/epimerase [Enterobacteriaceae bacterium]
MKTVQGPGIFLSQFIGEEAPFNTLEGLAEWAARLGYKALQIPCNHRHIFDLELAALSQTYCDEIAGTLASYGLVISELSTHLEGQLVAVHPAYDAAFDNFAPEHLRGNPIARQAWAVEKVTQAAVASLRLGLRAHATFSGALAWPWFYPWPPHNALLLDEAFAELARRWRPILDRFDRYGVDLCFEIHPGEDLHDGVTFRIKAFHVKDAEFRLNGRSGVYGGYQPWVNRAGRFRSPGDGQIDFGAIFSKLTQYGYDGWAVLEWECCLKQGDAGAREGCEFIRRHIIPVADRAFDDFAAGSSDRASVRAMLGLGDTL